MKILKNSLALFFVLFVFVLIPACSHVSQPGHDAKKMTNLCAKNACNPCVKNVCNPCGKGMKNACNPCAKNVCNPCYQ
jgi:hypothetical protein